MNSRAEKELKIIKKMVLDNRRTTQINIKVISDSMYPTILIDEVIRVLITYDEPKVGDVIVFIKDQDIFCHRVIYKNQNGIITKGDNNVFHDSGILQLANVCGIVQISDGITELNGFQIYMAKQYYSLLERIVSKELILSECSLFAELPLMKRILFWGLNRLTVLLSRTYIG